MPGGRPIWTNPTALEVIPSLERAGCLRMVTAARGVDGRPPLRRDIRPAPIGVTLAETAGTAETPPAQPSPTSALIGRSLAEIAEIHRPRPPPTGRLRPPLQQRLLALEQLDDGIHDRSEERRVGKEC